jgi:hypothetical protein
MKKLYILFVIGFISFFSYSQEANCGWDYSVTANNAVIAIQADNFNNMLIGFDSNTMLVNDVPCPMLIGVFYLDDNGEYACGGYTEWDGSQSMALAAWGDDSTTSEKDGFAEGEAYVFKMCIGYEMGTLIDDNPNMSTEAPFSDSYATNGFGSIDGAFFIPDLITIDAGDPICFPFVDLKEEESVRKHIVKTVDIYGREIMNNHNGIVFQIYSDKSVSKRYKINY